MENFLERVPTVLGRERVKSVKPVDVSQVGANFGKVGLGIVMDHFVRSRQFRTAIDIN